MNVVATAHDILRELEAESKKHGVVTITRVHVKMGTLCDIVPDDLTHAFRIVADGTIASGAELNIGLVTAKGQCPTCGADIPVGRKDGQGFFCAQCGESVNEPVSGQQLEVALIRGEAQRPSRSPTLI